MSLKYVDNYGNEENIAGLGKPGSSVNAIGRLSSGTAIGDIVSDGKVTTFYAPTSPVTKYYTAWANSLVFYLPLGCQALVMLSFNAVYLVWNPNDALQVQPLFGSGATFKRDSTDKTKITVTTSGSNTMTALVL